MKKLNSIISTFNRTIVELEDLISSNNKRIGKNDKVIAKRAAANTDMTVENQRAFEIKSNIKQLLGMTK